MALPQVKILIQNGQLGGSFQIADGIAALIGNGAATAGLSLSTPKVIFGLTDLDNLGVTSANNPQMYRHVKAFYAQAGDGAELWIMIVPTTMTMDIICDQTNNSGLISLLDAAGGRVRIAGVFSSVAGTVANNIDSKFWPAIQNAHELAESRAEDQDPVRIMLGAFNIVDNLPGTDLKTMSYNRVMAIYSSESLTDWKSGAVGLALGSAAALPAQRKISRVKNGALNIATGYFWDIDAVNFPGAQVTVHDQGYTVIRTFPAKFGYYWGGDHTCTSDADDFRSLANGRVIDKAQIVTYLTLVNELDEEVPIENGKLSRGYTAYLEGLITDRIQTSMTGQISAVRAYVDPNQDVLATSRIKVVLYIVPVGYASEIEVSLGFSVE